MADAGDSDGEERDTNPRTRLMEEVAAQMDAIEEDFGDEFEIRKVITILELQRPDGTTGVRVRSVSPILEALGLMRIAEDAIKAQGDVQDE
jgi:hypothetical protein